MVPESGRFIVSYMKLTCASVAMTPAEVAPLPATAAAPAGPPPLNLQTRNPTIERLVRQLARVWIDFETRLHQVPIVAKLETGRFSRDDYKLLLLNLRQQVVEGARWIARAASQMDAERVPAAQPLHHARARGAPRLPAARAKLRERRRRRRRDPQRREEHRQRGAVGLDVSPGEPGEPVRSPGRDVHHRGAGRAAGGALGRADQGAARPRRRPGLVPPLSRRQRRPAPRQAGTGARRGRRRRRGWSTASSRPRR